MDNQLLTNYTGEVIYYLIVTFCAFCSGFARAVYNGNFESYWKCLWAAIIAAGLGFGVVAMTIGDSTAIGTRGASYVGMATLIGLAGKEGVQAISAIWKALVGKITG